MALPFSHHSRRQFLKGVTAGATAAMLATGARADNHPASAGLISRENEKPGTRDWMLTNTRIDPAAKYRCPWIEGYCSHTSIRAGETLRFFVSTNPASDFTLDIFRLGYYGGDGGRLDHALGPFTGVTQADPPIARSGCAIAPGRQPRN